MALEQECEKVKLKPTLHDLINNPAIATKALEGFLRENPHIRL